MRRLFDRRNALFPRRVPREKSVRIARSYIFMALLCCPSILQATPVDLVWHLDSTFASDTYISQKFPTLEYGSADSLIVGNKGKVRRALLQFAMPPLLPGATIDSSVLTVALTRFGGLDGTVLNYSLHRVLESWDSSPGNGTTWNERSPGTVWSKAGAAYDGSAISVATVSSSDDSIQWEITPLVQFWIANPDSNFGLLIRAVKEVVVVVPDTLQPGVGIIGQDDVSEFGSDTNNKTAAINTNLILGATDQADSTKQPKVYFLILPDPNLLPAAQSGMAEMEPNIMARDQRISFVTFADLRFAGRGIDTGVNRFLIPLPADFRQPAATKIVWNGNTPIWTDLSSPDSLIIGFPAPISSDGIFEITWEVDIPDVGVPTYVSLDPFVDDTSTTFAPQILPEGDVNGVAGDGNSLALTVIGPLVGIEILPQVDTVDTDTTIQFTVTGSDADGNPVTITPTWSMSGAVGALDRDTGFLDPNTVGQAFIIATASGVSDSLFLTVIPGSAAYIIVGPDSITSAADNTIQFFVVAVDGDFNWYIPSAAWTEPTGLGVIDSTGYFDPVLPGTGLVVAGVDDVVDTAAFTITVGALASLTVSPVSALLNTEQSISFSAAGWDSDGNAIAGLPPLTWSGAQSIGIIDPATGLFEADVTGKDVVRVSAGTVQGASDTIVVVPGPTRWIDIAPDSTIVVLGNRSLFSASTIDGDSNSTNDAVNWSVQGGIGTISPAGLLTTTAPGDGSVVASLPGAVSDTATITVLDNNGLVVVSAVESREGVTQGESGIPVDVIYRNDTGGSLTGISLSLRFEIDGQDISAEYSDSLIGSPPDTLSDGQTDTLRFYVTVGTEATTGAAVTIDVDASAVTAFGDGVGSFEAGSKGSWVVSNPPSIEDLVHSLFPTTAVAGQASGFWIGVKNEGGTSLQLDIASALFFSDGVDSFVAPISAAPTIPADSQAVSLLFDTANVPEGFDPGDYVLDLRLRGLDGNGAIFAGTVTTQFNSLTVLPPFVQVRALAVDGLILEPGADSISLMRLELVNLYSTARTLTELTLTNAIQAGGSTADRDGVWNAIRLINDEDGNGRHDQGEDLLGEGSFENGLLTLNGLGLVMAGGDTTSLLVTGDLSLLQAPDGAELNVQVGTLNHFEFNVGTAIDATFPLDSPGNQFVDGMIAAQIITSGGFSTELPAGADDSLAMVFDLPSNGFLPDTLHKVSIINSGNPGEQGDITEVLLWKDGGNGLFDGGSGDDALVHLLGWIGEWTWSNLGIPVAPGGERFFVTVDIAETPASGGVVELSIPVGGIDMTSSNDGPLDRRSTSPTIKIIGDLQGVVVSNVMPGEADSAFAGSVLVEALRFTLGNLDSISLELRELTVSNRSSGTSAPPDSIARSASLIESASGAVLAEAVFDEGEATFTGLGSGLDPGESVEYAILLDIGTSCLTDGDWAAVAIHEASSFVFESDRLMIGPFPIASDSIRIRSLSSSQIVMYDVEGGGATAGTAGRLALRFRLPAAACESDALLEFSVDNDSGTADTTDIDRVYLTYGESNETFVSDLFFNGTGWGWISPGLVVDPGGIVLNVRIDFSDSARDSRTLRLRIPENGIEMLSSNDGPVDGPVVSPTKITVSGIPLFAAITVPDSPVSRGQQYEVFMDLENVDESDTLDMARPDSFGCEVFPLTIVLEPPGDSLVSLPPGGKARFRWVVVADEEGTHRFTGNAIGVRRSTGLPDTTFITQSAFVTVQSPPTGLVIVGASTIEGDVIRGARDLSILRLTFSHPDQGASYAAVRVDSVRVSFDDGQGNLIAPADFIDRLKLDALGSLSVADLDSDVASIPLSVPIVLDPGSERTITLSLDLSLTSPVETFRAVIEPSNAVAAYDRNSGLPVSVTSNDPIFSAGTAIVNPPQGLTVLVADTLLSQSNRSDTVTILSFDLKSEGTGAIAEVGIGSISFVLADGDFPFDWVEITDRGLSPLFSGSDWVREGSLVRFPLTDNILVRTGETSEIEIIARVASSAPVGRVQLDLDDLVFFGDFQLQPDINPEVRISRDIPLVTRIVKPAVSIEVSGLDPADTTEVVPGTLDRQALSLRFHHAMGDSFADIRIRGFSIRLENSAGDSVEIRSILERATVLDDGRVLASIVPRNQGSATLEIPFSGSFLRLQGGEDTTLVLAVDIRDGALPGDYRFVVFESGIDIADNNSGAPVAATIDGNSAYRSTPLRIRRESEGVTVWVDLDIPPTTVAGSSLDDVGQIRILSSGGIGVSDLHLKSIRLEVQDGDGNPLSPSAVLSDAWATPAGDGATTSDGILETDHILFPFDTPLAVVPGETLSITLDLTLATEIEVESFRFEFPVDKLSFTESDQAITRAVNDPGTNPSSPAHLAKKEFEASVRNYPNPFSTSEGGTIVAFYAKSPCHAAIRIYTGLGTPVRSIEQDVSAAGLIELPWDGRNGDGKRVLSGAYLASIELKYHDGGRDHAIHKIAVLH